MRRNSKFFKIMKIVVVVFLAIMLVLGSIMPALMYARAEEVPVVTDDTLQPPLLIASKPNFSMDGDNIVIDADMIYNFWSNFANTYQDRTGTTTAERQSAEYLAEQFERIGLAKEGNGYLQEITYFEEESTNTTVREKKQSQNVVGVLKSDNSNGKKIIISAHYDNTFAMSSGLKSNGAYDNASGVAVVMALAEAMSHASYDFDVYFVLFGAEEIGMKGSQAYISRMSQVERNNTLLMINVDSIVCGDNLYVYTDEVKRSHDELFFNADKNGLLSDFNGQKWSIINSYNEDRLFVHDGHLSDNMTFVMQGINAISFTGYNYDVDGIIGGKESATKAELMHTSMDTVGDIINIYGEEFVKNRLSGLSSIIINAVSDDGFVASMENSKNNNPVANFVYTPVFVYGVSMVFLIGFMAIIYMIVKAGKKEEAELPKQQTKVKFSANGQSMSAEEFRQFMDELRKNTGGQYPPPPPRNNQEEKKSGKDDDDVFKL